MSKTETPVSQLKINRLTKTQFEGASDLSETELYAVDPEFVGGKLLKTDSNGDIVESTATEGDTLPSQSGQSGKFLTTNGSNASWGDVPTEIPSQSGQSGKYLTTNGTSVSWGSITIPTVNNATLTIQKNGSNVATFTANASSNVTANISVPTQASDISAVASNTAIIGATKCKITYDSKGLVTAGADLSSSDITTALGYTPLGNTATGTNSLSIEGTPSSSQYATNVGKNSQASNSWTTAIGQLAKATGESSISIGNSTTASGKKSIAIGNSANVSGIGTIQIGRGTTTDNGCFYVGLTENGTTHNNYKVLDATGKIPNDRLTISTSMSSSSTDSQIPSLKLLFDTCGDIEALINAL